MELAPKNIAEVTGKGTKRKNNPTRNSSAFNITIQKIPHVISIKFKAKVE